MDDWTLITGRSQARTQVDVVLALAKVSLIGWDQAKDRAALVAGWCGRQGRRPRLCALDKLLALEPARSG